MRSFLLAFSFALSSTAACAQTPQIVHAQLSTRSASHGLAAEIASAERSPAATWIGYSIPVEASFDGSWGEPIAYLERHDSYTRSSRQQPGTKHDHAVLLLRTSAGKVDQMRVESPDRTFDAGDLPFIWLDNVTPEDSIATLRTVALDPAQRRQSDAAIFLISLHRSPAALPALVAIAAPANDVEVRGKAAFWLANQCGQGGFAAIQRFARKDADARFREKLTFDLTLVHTPDAAGAQAELIRMAHEDASPKVRAQAQFWMAQRGGQLVSASLQRSATSDPDRDTRNQAVFALSRLPGDEAATQLIELAHTSKDANVRQQAIFWLGQSKDPRALAYLTQILTGS